MIEDTLLRELLELSREQATMGARLDALEGRMGEMVETISLIRVDAHKMSTDMANLAGRMQEYFGQGRGNPPVSLTVTATADTSRHAGGEMHDVNIGGNNQGDIAGGSNNKNPTKLLIIAVIVLVLVVGAIAGVKAIIDKDSVQVEPPPGHRSI